MEEARPASTIELGAAGGASAGASVGEGLASARRGLEAGAQRGPAQHAAEARAIAAVHTAGWPAAASRSLAGGRRAAARTRDFGGRVAAAPGGSSTGGDRYSVTAALTAFAAGLYQLRGSERGQVSKRGRHPGIWPRPPPLLGESAGRTSAGVPSARGRAVCADRSAMTLSRRSVRRISLPAAFQSTGRVAGVYSGPPAIPAGAGRNHQHPPHTNFSRHRGPEAWPAKVRDVPESCRGQEARRRERRRAARAVSERSAGSSECAGGAGGLFCGGVKIFMPAARRSRTVCQRRETTSWR